MDENSFNKLFELVKDENLDKFNVDKICVYCYVS